MMNIVDVSNIRTIDSDPSGSQSQINLSHQRKSLSTLPLTAESFAWNVNPMQPLRPLFAAASGNNNTQTQPLSANTVSVKIIRLDGTETAYTLTAKEQYSDMMKNTGYLPSTHTFQLGDKFMSNNATVSNKTIVQAQSQPQPFVYHVRVKPQEMIDAAEVSVKTREAKKQAVEKQAVKTPAPALEVSNEIVQMHLTVNDGTPVISDVSISTTLGEIAKPYTENDKYNVHINEVGKKPARRDATIGSLGSNPISIQITRTEKVVTEKVVTEKVVPKKVAPKKVEPKKVDTPPVTAPPKTSVNIITFVKDQKKAALAEIEIRKQQKESSKQQKLQFKAGVEQVLESEFVNPEWFGRTISLLERKGPAFTGAQTHVMVNIPELEELLKDVDFLMCVAKSFKSMFPTGYIKFYPTKVPNQFCLRVEFNKAKKAEGGV
jgi:hypothetical protein